MHPQVMAIFSLCKALNEWLSSQINDPLLRLITLRLILLHLLIGSLVCPIF